MAEDYKIKLGVSLDTNNLRTEIRKLDGKEKIKLGVDVKVNDIKERIASYNKNANNAKLKLGVKLDTDDLKRQINQLNLGGTGKGTNKGVAIPVNTQSLETSLKEVKGIVSSIQSAIGNIGDGSEMKPLLSSVNQIADALGKVGNETQNVISALNALGKKDFNINLGVNVGGANNPIARNAAYGNKVRGETLPQLKQQAESLVKYVNDYYKTSYNEFEALQKLVHGTKLGTGDFYQNFLFGEDSVASRMSGGSLAGQMQAFKQYIDMFKQAASLKGINLDSVTSQFESPEKLIKAAQDIQTGANEAEKGIEKFKNLFGASIDADALSAQLTPIVEKLEEIRVAISNLSNNESLGGLTASFDKLSGTLETLLANAKQVQDVLGGGLQGSNVDSKTSNIAKDFKEASVQIDTTEAQIESFTNALKSIGISDNNIDSIIQKFKELGITVTNVTSKLNSDGSVVKLSVKGLDKDKNLVTAVNSLNKDGLLSGWTTTVSENSKEIENGFTRLKSLAKEIGNLKIDIFKSDDADEIREMSVELDKLQAEYKELHAQIGSGLTSGQEAQLSSSFAKTEETLSKLKKSHSEAKAELAGKIELNLHVGDFDEKIGKIRQDAKSLSGTYNDIENGISKLNQALKGMKTAAAQGDVDGLIKSYKQYEATLKAVENQIDQNRMAEKNATDSTKLEQKKQSLALEMKNWLKDNSAAAQDFGARIRELEMQIDACDDSSLGNLRREFQNIKKEAQLAGKTTKTVGDRIKEQFAQYSTYLGVAEMFMWAEQGLRDMFEQVKSIDSAMTELKKVTNETDAAYSQFLSNAGSRAKEIGTTIDGLVSSTADFARLGYDFADAQGLAEVANIYAVVGDDIDSVETATQSLISTLTAFKDEAGDLSESDFALSIVDKMNEVANNFAISSGGLGDALQRSASSMMAANNSLDETIALITAANTVVQDPDSVGTAFKTISMRMKIHCPQ